MVQMPISPQIVTDEMVEQYRQTKRAIEDLLLQTDRAINAGIAVEAQKEELKQNLDKVNKFLKVYG